MEKQKGLYRKYRIEKTDGSTTDPKAQYFVLRIDTDPHARVALGAYTMSVFIDNPQLACDLAAWLDHWWPRNPVSRRLSPEVGDWEEQTER